MTLADAFAAHARCRWPPIKIGSAPGNVFCVELDQAGLEENWLGFLSREEIFRSQRFATTTLRLRYIAAHLALRAILSDAIGCEPGILRFAVGLRGKPFIADPPEGRSWRFSLSHSGPVALIAIAQDIEVGVDVEQVLPLASLEDFIGATLSSEEKAALPTQSASRLRRFYATWTAKEAALKALGIGLALAPNRFEASCGSFVPLDRTMPHAVALGMLAYSSLEPSPDMIAALACRSVKGFEFGRWPR